MLDRADAPAERDADDDRQRHQAARPVSHLRQLVDDLVGGREDEAVELDLAHRPVAAQREADGGADDPRLGERRVHHAVLTEVFLEAVGDPEHAAELADVLTHDEHLGVGFERPAHPLVQGTGKSELAHRAASSNPSRYASYSARSASRMASGPAYTCSNAESGGGSGNCRQPSRMRVPKSSASASTCSKNAASAWPERVR